MAGRTPALRQPYARSRPPCGRFWYWWPFWWCGWWWPGGFCPRAADV